MTNNTVTRNNQQGDKEVDLFSDDYAITLWPQGKLHAEKFPYIVIRLCWGTFSLVSIPEETRMDPQRVLSWLNQFIREYKKDAALVLDPYTATYFNADGREQGQSTTPPTGGTMVNWKKYQNGTIRSLDKGTAHEVIYAETNDSELQIIFDARMSAEKAKETMERVRYEEARRKYYISFIPHRLEIEERPELSIFPLNVLFGGPALRDGKFYPMVRALYEPDPTTLKDGENTVSMVYTHAKGIPNQWLMITYDKERKSYEGEKFVDSISVGSAYGKEWNMFFSHFTMLGVHEKEDYEVSLHQ